MRDVFYTILVVWIIWRIMEGFNSVRSASKPQQEPVKNNENNYRAKKKLSDNEGEYVDFEEVK